MVLDATDTLQPLLEEKNAAHSQFLQVNSVSAKKELRRHQRTVKRAVDAVDAAKEEWICKVAGNAEKAKKDGRQRQMCVRQLQIACRGRRPRTPTVLLKENGEMTASPEEVKKQWHHHFSRILTVPSEYRQEITDGMPSRPPFLELGDPPTLEELLSALSKLKKGKAGGKTGILPELLLCGGAELRNRLLQVMQDVWESGTVVQGWKDAVIVPIPMKGNLKGCDNWWASACWTWRGSCLRVSSRRDCR